MQQPPFPGHSGRQNPGPRPRPATPPAPTPTGLIGCRRISDRWPAAVRAEPWTPPRRRQPGGDGGSSAPAAGGRGGAGGMLEAVSPPFATTASRQLPLLVAAARSWCAHPFTLPHHHLQAAGAGRQPVCTRQGVPPDSWPILLWRPGRRAAPPAQGKGRAALVVKFRAAQAAAMRTAAVPKTWLLTSPKCSCHLLLGAGAGA